MKVLLKITIIYLLLCLPFVVLEAWAQKSYSDLVRKIQPSVITVVTFDNSGNPVNLGSGFFINKKGYFITNYHVLEGATKAWVKTSEGGFFNVNSILSSDKDGDLVLAAIDTRRTDFPNLKVTSITPNIGERIIVIGSPLGLEQTLSDGLISAVRSIKRFGEILQISAPISPGSSGGPVINLKGEVVGVATLMMIGGQNLNFAITGARVLVLEQKTHKGIGISDRLKLESLKPVPKSREKYDKPCTDDENRIILSLMLQGFQLTREINYNEAIDVYKKVVELDSNHIMAHYYLGELYCELNQFKKAIDEYQIVNKLDPETGNKLRSKITKKYSF